MCIDQLERVRIQVYRAMGFLEEGPNFDIDAAYSVLEELDEEISNEIDGEDLDSTDDFEDDVPSGVKYPNIKVQLTGGDGNAFTILGKVKQALRRGGVSEEEQAAFFAEATSGDYDHVLATCMDWVDVS